jgi:hypothetical protein
MIFRSRSRSARRHQRFVRSSFQYKPVLHVLDYGQTSEDFVDPIEQSLLEPDVVISRAELDLKRSMQRLTLITHSALNAFHVLIALFLPGNAAAVFWAIRLLLADELPGTPSQTHLIHKRNHDSRFLYQALHQVDLHRWYGTTVDKAHITDLPADVQFPPGHPLPNRYYRQHPLPARRLYYLPVVRFFPMLLAERKQELIRLLVELGATQITIADPSPDATTAPEVLEYAGKPWAPGLRLQAANYSWFPYESAWQTLATHRYAGSAKPTQIDLTLDISHLMASQLDALEMITAQLDSVGTLNCKNCYYDYLKPLRFEVRFGRGGAQTP